jgi:hypothetical protein
MYVAEGEGLFSHRELVEMLRLRGTIPTFPPYFCLALMYDTTFVAVIRVACEE